MRMETERARRSLEIESKHLRGEVKKRQRTEEDLRKSQTLLNETQRLTMVCEPVPSIREVSVCGKVFTVSDDRRPAYRIAGNKVDETAL